MTHAEMRKGHQHRECALNEGECAVFGDAEPSGHEDRACERKCTRARVPNERPDPTASQPAHDWQIRSREVRGDVFYKVPDATHSHDPILANATVQWANPSPGGVLSSPSFS